MLPRDLILNNFWQKIFSLILAILIWVAIDSSYVKNGRLPQDPIGPTSTRDLRCPVHLLTPATSPHSFKVDREEVDVRISGESTRLQQVDPNTVRVYVNLTKVNLSQMTTNDLYPLEVNCPREVKVELISPDKVSVVPLPPTG